MTSANPSQTRDRLLDAAERLFGEKGVGEVSLRDITREADANLAAVNYHFGSRDGLLREVFLRRLRPLNEERIALLDKASPGLAPILQAFVGPTLRMCREHPEFMRLASRTHLEPVLGEDTCHLEESRFPELIARFREALIQTLPDKPPGEIWWGMDFLIGALLHTWASWEEVEQLSGGEATYGSDTMMVERLVAFGVAGLSAIPDTGRGEE